MARRGVLGIVVALAGCSPGHAPPRSPARDAAVPQKGDLPPGDPPTLASRAPAGDRSSSGLDAVASCVDDGAPFDEASLKARITYLASAELDGRAPASDGDRAARAHAIARFRCLGIAPGGADGSYEQPFDADGAATANLVGFVKGTDATVGGDIIVVGAHLDHEGGGHLGANDNASGSAAVLAIAQHVARLGPRKRTVAFVLFNGEEKGLLGSLYYVAHPPAALPLDRVVEMINIDMIGSYSAKKAVLAFGAFPKLAATRLITELDDRYPKTRFRLGGNSVRGDHFGFCRAKIPYIFFWTPDPKCYHQACDTADRLDYPHLVDIASLAGDLVERLADSDADLAAARARSGCGTR